MGTDEYQSRDTAQEDDELIDEMKDSFEEYKRQKSQDSMGPRAGPGRSRSPRNRDAKQESLGTLRDDIKEYADRHLDSDDWQALQDATGNDEYSANTIAHDVVSALKDKQYTTAKKQLYKLGELAEDDDMMERFE